MEKKIIALKTGKRTNPKTGEEVISAFAVVQGLDKPVRILDTIDELKEAGKPAEVMSKLLFGEHPEHGYYAYLPKILFQDLDWK